MNWKLVLVKALALSQSALFLFFSLPFPSANVLWILKFCLKTHFSRAGLVLSSRHVDPRRGTRWEFTKHGATFNAWLQGPEKARLRLFLGGLEIWGSLYLPGRLFPEKPWDFSCFSEIFWSIKMTKENENNDNKINRIIYACLSNLWCHWL